VRMSVLDPNWPPDDLSEWFIEGRRYDLGDRSDYEPCWPCGVNASPGRPAPTRYAKGWTA
jgi:hypothetical protein